jgi:hypothetical protein
LKAIDISSNQYRLLMVGLFLAEASLLTIFNNLFGVYLSPVVLFAIGVTMGFAPLYLRPVKGIDPSVNSKLNLYLQAALVLGSTLLVSIMLYNVITRIPVDVHNSDIIPQMQVLVTRFLEGSFPYRPVTEWGYTLFPTYQPLQWLPFSFAELLKIDYRWTGLIVWLAGVLLYQWKLRKERLQPPYLVALSLLPFLVFAAFYKFEWSVLAYTVELLIAGYYLFLAFSTRNRSVWLIAAGIVLCLLSRYSLIFWLPLYFLVLFFQWDKKKATVAGLLVLAGIVLIYVLPFLSHDWTIFLQGYQYHSGAALGEWMHAEPGQKAYHLFHGVGFACYFYDFAGGELVDRLKFLQKVHLGACIFTVVCLGIWYFRWLRHRISPRVFLLCSLKIYLVVFYTFIQIPYIYLMLVPLFAGLPLLLTQLVVNEGDDSLPASTSTRS